MSNLGFSLDRNFNANGATMRREHRMAPAVANARKTFWLWRPASIAALSLAAALFGALAAKLLF